jgi:hypothetical protein
MMGTVLGNNHFWLDAVFLLGHLKKDENVKKAIHDMQLLWLFS